MYNQSFITCLWSFRLVAGLAALAMPLLPAPITHFASAVSVVQVGTEGIQTFNLGPGLSANSSSESVANDNGTALAIAESDLSTGTLRVLAFAESNSEAAGTRAVASFGDSFRFFGGLGPTAAVNFTLTLDGVFIEPQFPSSPLWNNSIIEFQVWTPGNLDFGVRAGGPGLIYRQAYRVGPGSDQNLICGNPECTTQVPETIPVLETFPQILQYDFVPGGDFDWALLIRIAGGASAAGDTFIGDFMNTATLQFNGPLAYSGSGLFPGTLQAEPVPEPGTWWLAATTLLAPVFRRRAIR